MFPQKNQTLMRLQNKQKALNNAIIKFWGGDRPRQKADFDRIQCAVDVKAALILGKNRRKKAKFWVVNAEKPEVAPTSRGNSIKFRDFLEKKGFIKLGSGCHGSVYGHPKSDRVIKVNHVNDCWIDFMKWSHDNGFAGKFTPRLYSFKNHGRFSVSVIDRMDATVRDTENTEADFLMQTFSYIGHNGRKSCFATECLDKHNPGMAEFAERLGRWANDNHFHRDWHRDNFMMKSGKLMATDPISSGYAYTFPHKRIRLCGTELKVA